MHIVIELTAVTQKFGMRLIISFRFSKNGFRNLLYFCSTLRISSDAFSFSASISFWHASICSNDSDSTSLNPSSIKRKQAKEKQKKGKLSIAVNCFQQNLTTAKQNKTTIILSIFTHIVVYYILNMCSIPLDFFVVDAILCWYALLKTLLADSTQ